MTEYDIDLDSFVADYERHERNEVDFDDIRFGEIYLDNNSEESYD